MFKTKKYSTTRTQTKQTRKMPQLPELLYLRRILRKRIRNKFRVDLKKLSLETDRMVSIRLINTSQNKKINFLFKHLVMFVKTQKIHVLHIHFIFSALF